MTKPAIPDNEAERLRNLHEYGILDTPSEPLYDNLVRLAASICGTSVSLISLVDSDRCWFRGNYGLEDMSEAPRDIAYAAHAINSENGEPFIVEDALQDERFSDSPLLHGDPAMRFYIGIPLIDERGFVLGTLCIIDDKPHRVDPKQLKILQSLASQVVEHLQLQREMQSVVEMNRQLKSRNEDLEEYAAIISHDLKEPLRTIMGYGELLEEEYGTRLPEEAHQYLRSIANSGNHMYEMVGNLLAYARLGRSQYRVRFALQPVVEEVLMDLGRVISEQGAKIRIDALPEVYGYPAEVRQLMQNLIANALKFTREGVTPQVHITAKSGGGKTEIQVIDNGIGIPEDEQERIFRMFERGGNHSRTNGQGVGLAFCRKIVDLHQGSLGVVSTPGRGSSFWFTLPD